jgi:formylglycine-generating enzyme required for sulfatase activity
MELLKPTLATYHRVSPMQTNATVRRLAFSFGLLAAAAGSVANSAEPKAGDVIENSIKMKFVFIPPGEFDMGSPESESGRYLNHETLHHVKLTKGFYLGKYEVTQSQFQLALRRNPSFFRDGVAGRKVDYTDSTSFPVENVTWFDAVEFCNALSKTEQLPAFYTLRKIKRNKAEGWIEKADVAVNGGTGYRLPTEAEWEYACRAGTKAPFHFGETLNGKEANVNGTYGTTTPGPYLKRPCTVGSYPANAFGLHDMHGNVWEWCHDRYAGYDGDEVDPTGSESRATRSTRGGSWNDDAQNARSAQRNGSEPHIRNYGRGLRVARTP